MAESPVDPRLLEQLKKLNEKYEIMGQDLASYLDGLLYSRYLSYWDYINLDTLLSLQNPRTDFPDENIFIIYHQITELYFKLILLEMDQMLDEQTEAEAFLMRLKRVNRYIYHLSHSFAIMEEGMEPQQFLKFRMALLPASGFQSAQYRKIEITSTDFINLCEESWREKLPKNGVLPELYDKLYWRKGAIEMKSMKKTLTLKQFEEKYESDFLILAEKNRDRNINSFYKRFENDPLIGEIKAALKTMDVNFNINWSLAHYKSAVKYLQKSPEDIKATGGTNWQKFLPPRFQRVVFFPALWTADELKEWGKAWVEKEIFAQF